LRVGLGGRQERDVVVNVTLSLLTVLGLEVMVEVETVVVGSAVSVTVPVVQSDVLVC
jgi:hypothetical protein